jgi:hypothetical protein
MNIDTMRWIDRYVGVPLCAIATPLVRLWHRTFARTPGSAPRVLFVEMSEMGSTILAAPAMQKARERLGAELFFVIFRRNVGSLELLGMIPQDNVFTILGAAQGHRHGDRSRIVFTLHRAVDRIFRRLAARRFLPVSSGGSLSR